MKKVLYIIPVLLFTCTISFAQYTKGQSFFEQYVTAQAMLKAAMQYSDPEKIAMFFNQSNRATMNAMTVFKDVKQKLTPTEAKNLDLALDFMLNWSNKDYFEDQDIFKITLWFKLNENKQQKTLAKLIK